MSIDESFSDDISYLSSPIRSSDRLLRSSTISMEGVQPRRDRLIEENQLFVGRDKDCTYRVESSSRAFQKIRLSIDRWVVPQMVDTVNVSPLSSATNHQISERSSQIFDIHHRQKCMETSYICLGERLEALIDREKNSYLFHENGLKYSVCDKVTDLTNFPNRWLLQI